VKNWRVWVGLLISALFLYLAFSRIDIWQTWQALQTANYLWLLPSLVAYFIGVGVRAVRWRYLLRQVKEVTARRLFPVIVIGYMANDVLPLRTGELVRAYVLRRREGISASAGLATIVVERLFDGLAMLTFIVVVIAFFVPLPGSTSPGALDLGWLTRTTGLLFLVALVVFLVIAASRQRALALFDCFARPLPAGPRQRLRGLADAFLGGLVVLQHPTDAFIAFALTLLAWLFEATMYLLLLPAFNLAQPFSVILLTTAVANLGTILPSTPGYVGVFDALVMGVLTLFGQPPLPAEAALSYALVVHAALYFPITLWGFYYAWKEGVPLRKGIEL